MPTKKTKHLPKSEAPVRLYKRIAIGFLILTGLLVAVAVYFVLNQAEITIVLAKEPVSADFIVNIKETAEVGKPAPSAGESSAPEIFGKLIETTVSASKEYKTSGKKYVEGETGGKVTIFNNYSKTQPLVATTRLLSPEGILYRTQKRVDVPAGGKVEVDVYADPPSEAAAKLGPTRFTIPGLWPGLQDKIFGQSFEAMSGSPKEINFVNQQDLDNAYDDLTQTLADRVVEMLKEQMPAAGEILSKVVIKEINEKNSDWAAGEPGEKFTATLKLKVVGVAFYKKDIEDLSYRELRAKAPAEKELINTDYDNLTFLIEKYDIKSGEANIMAHLDGEMSLRADSQIFDAEQLLGLSREKVIQYLSVYPEIERVTIKFSPFWINKVPQLKSNVKIIIKK